jgi:hypothetical protein
MITGFGTCRSFYAAQVPETVIKCSVGGVVGRAG